MDIEELKSLRERVLAASGPDREIDGAFFEIINPELAQFRVRPGWYEQPYPYMPGSCKIVDFAEDYSASVDAALGLVERMLPGWEWLKKSPGCVSLYEVPADDKTWAYHHTWKANTFPLAILAALLSVLIARASCADAQPPA